MAEIDFIASQYIYFHSGGNAFRDEGLKILLKFNWSQLRKLFLSGCLLTDEGLDYLPSEWPNLEVLKLNRNSITSKGLTELSKKPWTKLTNLHVRDNKIDDQGGLGFVEGAWPSLKTVKFGTFSIIKIAMSYQRMSGRRSVRDFSKKMWRFLFD